MRRWFTLNALVVAAAALGALALTITHRTPGGVVSFSVEQQQVRAAPGDRPSAKHNLSALKIFNLTLVRIKENYVDPSRIDPKKMLYQALDSVQFNIPEVLVEEHQDKDSVDVVVNDKTESFETGDVDSPWRLARKLSKVFRFVEENMNEGADLAEVEYAAVNGMLATLDPHSELMDPEAAREMDVTTSGKFGGLGIVIRMLDKKLTVIRPMKGTPADKKGMKSGDVITKIDSEPTENLTLNEAVDRMRGDPGTPVTLWVTRKGETKPLEFDLVRDVIRVESVVYKLLDKNVGYIKIKQFSSSTGAETERAMADLQSQGATGWVLDLRGNPGGLLEQAIAVSDLFVDAGTIVTTVSGKERDPRRAEKGDGDTQSPLAILVNGGSASASEIVTGALKNLDRGIVIGTRTFGKGSVQVLYDNDDGSKLKLTVAEYLTPGDRSIQTLGIVPDIQLHRMYVPDKNNAVGDWVRLLPPTHSWSEADYDAAIKSKYARDDEQPSYELSYVYQPPGKKKVAALPQGAQPSNKQLVDPNSKGKDDKTKATIPEHKGADDDAATNSPPDPAEEDASEDLDDADEIQEDFEMTVAKEVVQATHANNRPDEIKDAKAVVAKHRVEQDKALSDALTTLGVDWSAPPANQNAQPALTATMQVTAAATPTTPLTGGQVAAGTEVVLTGSLTNTGPGTAWRVHGRVDTDDQTFEDTELVFGKVATNETKTFSVHLKIPPDSPDRLDHLSFHFTEDRGQPVIAPPVELRIDAAPRPAFAYSYQLIDDGNGDGLVQKGEAYRLRVTVKNTGTGPSAETTSVLRNASGDGVDLATSRFEVGNLKPGDAKTIEFGFTVTKALEGDAVVELMIWDNVLGVSSSEKLKFPVADAQTVTAASGTVELKKKADVYDQPSDKSDLIGFAAKGTKLKVLGTVGSYTKVELSANRPAFIASSRLSKSSGAASGSIDDSFEVTPPTISLTSPTYSTTAAAYQLSGTVSDETHVEDVYVFVSNAGAKIDGKKIFYLSNRGGKTDNKLDFSAEVPLWAGSNQITVIAREKADVRAISTMFVYKEDAKTADASGTTK